MNVKELRIGNWVLENNTKIKKVVSVSVDTILTTSAGKQLISPIPLTEQWLLDFGFRNDSLEMNNSKVEYLTLDYETDDVINCLIFQSNKLSGYSHIKYVHQLQNLYHSLTNKELTKK